MTSWYVIRDKRGKKLRVEIPDVETMEEYGIVKRTPPVALFPWKAMSRG
jgi:hypothetical protein